MIYQQQTTPHWHNFLSTEYFINIPLFKYCHGVWNELVSMGHITHQEHIKYVFWYTWLKCNTVTKFIFHQKAYDLKLTWRQEKFVSLNPLNSHLLLCSEDLELWCQFQSIMLLESTQFVMILVSSSIYHTVLCILNYVLHNTNFNCMSM